MRRRLTSLSACLVLVAVPLAGCGKKEPGIPRSDASELIKLLQTAREQSDSLEKCDDLRATIRDIRAKVRDLPSRTDSDVRDSLSNGVRNLSDSAASLCSEEKRPETNTTPTVPVPTETTPTETTPTETTPTETTPPETTPPETTPPETTPAPPVPTTPGTGGTPGNGNGNGKKDKDKKKRVEGAGHHGKGHDK